MNEAGRPRWIFAVQISVSLKPNFPAVWKASEKIEPTFNCLQHVFTAIIWDHPKCRYCLITARTIFMVIIYICNIGINCHKNVVDSSLYMSQFDFMSTTF